MQEFQFDTKLFLQAERSIKSFYIHFSLIALHFLLFLDQNIKNKLVATLQVGIFAYH